MTHALRRHIGALLRALLVLLFALGAGLAHAQGIGRDFDHTRTGFALTGAHTGERCESCHLDGIFKGTPRDCASCHSAGMRWARGNVVKPQKHVPGTQPCDACHTPHSFAGARFSHVGVLPGSCASCHNGSVTAGKTAGHILTSASCDTCHRSVAWTPASGFDHANVTPGSCITCHNGSRATGKSARHIPVGAQSCDACHRSGGGWLPSSFNHSQSLATPCASCHTGGYTGADGKPNNPLHAGATSCENCHKSTRDWSSARVDHASFSVATNCTSCHNGSAATGKAASHVPVGASNCANCHTVSTWKPSSFNHTQLVVTNQCASCHSGAYPPADGRNATHIPYQVLSGVAITNCDSCHRSGTRSWTPATFHTSVSVSTQCASCHTGSYAGAVGKPNNATHAGVTACEGCHKSASSWSNVNFGHSAANAVGSGTCDTCHNGSSAKGKPSGHIPVTTGPTKCDSCHRSQTSWTASLTMNHTVVAASTCKSCHVSTYAAKGATAKPSNHIPEATQLLNGASMDCNACHRSNTSWGSMTMDHHGSLGGGAGWCKGCHQSGTSYAASMEKKSLTHEKKTPPAIDCSESGCHRPLGSKGSTYREWD